MTFPAYMKKHLLPHIEYSGYCFHTNLPKADCFFHIGFYFVTPGLHFAIGTFSQDFVRFPPTFWKLNPTH